jgi:hypothetical protein
VSTCWRVECHGDFSHPPNYSEFIDLTVLQT